MSEKENSSDGHQGESLVRGLCFAKAEPLAHPEVEYSETCTTVKI